MTIIELMKARGLNPNERGTCYGLAIMAIMAYLLGEKEFKKHTDRMIEIKKITGEQQEEQINALLDNDKELDIFLTTIAGFQDPSPYTSILNLKKFSLGQEAIRIAPLIQSIMMEKMGGLQKAFVTVNCYQKKEFAKNLEEFSKTILNAREKNDQQTPTRWTMAISSDDHAIMLGYEATNSNENVWFIQNHDALDCFKTIDTVADEIFKIFTQNKENNNLLVTELYTTGKTLKNSKPIIEAWSSSAKLKKINELTKEKAEEKNNNEATLLFLAAQIGETELVRTLLTLGSDPKNKTKKGISAMNAALSNGHDECYQLLKAKGASINLIDEDRINEMLLKINIELKKAWLSAHEKEIDKEVRKKNDEEMKKIQIKNQTQKENKKQEIITLEFPEDVSEIRSQVEERYAAAFEEKWKQSYHKNFKKRMDELDINHVFTDFIDTHPWLLHEFTLDEDGKLKIDEIVTKQSVAWQYLQACMNLALFQSLKNIGDVKAWKNVSKEIFNNLEWNDINEVKLSIDKFKDIYPVSPPYLMAKPNKLSKNHYLHYL